MARRCFDYRRAKIHRSYVISEIAELYDVHRNTVRNWIKAGLPTIDGPRPVLVLGRDLRDFLQRKRSSGKHPCGPGEIYCVRCRRPQYPDGNVADYLPVTATTGNLVGICPGCGAVIYRRANLARLEQVRGKLEVTVREAHRHISESA